MAKNKVISEGAFTEDTKRIINHNFSDVSLCTIQFDAVTGTTGATLTNVVGMVTDELEIGNYKFTIKVPCVATANTGIKMALKWGTASMLSATSYNAVAYTASASVGSSRGTTLADQTLLFDSAAGAITYVEITGTVTVAIPGTLQFQAAQHTAHVDTVSVYANAVMLFEKIATN